MHFFALTSLILQTIWESKQDFQQKDPKLRQKLNVDGLGQIIWYC